MRAAGSQGSSPRVRGKPVPLLRAAAVRGLIPACAGKTRWTAWSSTAAAAHPRVCGENGPAPGLVPRVVGSSPRVRGKRRDHGPLRRPTRLIPACAGKTLLEAFDRVAAGAHPRVCGENFLAFGTDVWTAGSSPRVRGKPRPPTPGARAPGLIPACAGKTAAGPPRATPGRAHPRVCGENGDGVDDPRGAGGSSPRVRGKRNHEPGGVRACGLIPACAGKT